MSVRAIFRVFLRLVTWQLMLMLTECYILNAWFLEIFTMHKLRILVSVFSLYMYVVKLNSEQHNRNYRCHHTEYTASIPHKLSTFLVRRSRGEICIGHGRLCVCLSLAAFPHYCMDPDLTWGNGRRGLLVVYYWADLRSVHGFRCAEREISASACTRCMPGWTAFTTRIVSHRNWFVSYLIFQPVSAVKESILLCQWDVIIV